MQSLKFPMPVAQRLESYLCSNIDGRVQEGEEGEGDVVSQWNDPKVESVTLQWSLRRGSRIPCWIMCTDSLNTCTHKSTSYTSCQIWIPLTVKGNLNGIILEHRTTKDSHQKPQQESTHHKEIGRDQRTECISNGRLDISSFPIIFIRHVLLLHTLGIFQKLL